MKKIIFLIVFALFAWNMVYAQSNNLEKAKMQAIQRGDFNSAKVYVVKIGVIASGLACNARTLDDRIKYIRLYLISVLELSLLSFYNNDYDNARSSLATLSSAINLFADCSQQKIDDGLKSIELIGRKCNRRPSLLEHTKLLRKCAGMILPQTLNRVPSPPPAYVPSAPIYVPSGGGYSVPAENYRRNCSRPGHGSYDIRYGGCPACRAPQFGL